MFSFSYISKYTVDNNTSFNILSGNLQIYYNNLQLTKISES